MVNFIIACNMNTSNSESNSDTPLSASDSIYTIETEESQIVWTGRELSTSSHYGTLDFKSGEFEVSDGLIVNGEFEVDMTSLNNQDMDGGSKERLENHLKSDDFFSVDKFPSAHLYISSSEIVSEGKWSVVGFLTIKDKSHPLTFEMTNTSNGWTANLVFDRSLYDVRFRSGTFFENLGDKLILDEIELAINLKII